MKLKRLLPIASVAGVAAVIAPIVTSCGSATYSCAKDDWGEYRKNMTKPVGTGEITHEVTMTEQYLTNISKNKKILADEFIHNAYTYVGSLGLTKITVSVGSINPEAGRISFKITYDATNSAQWEFKTLTVDVKDMKYVLCHEDWRSQSLGWWLSPFAWHFETDKRCIYYLMYDKLWSIKATKVNGETSSILTYSWESGYTTLHSFVDDYIDTAWFSIRSQYWDYTYDEQ